MRIVLIISLLFLITSSQRCTDYLYNEVNCIQSNIQSCRWNQFMSQCMDSISTNLGCNSALNEKACLAQLSYPDNTLAECMFSGFCRKVATVFTTCSSILSRAACLSVYSVMTKVKCIWQEGCKTISDSEALQIASVDSLSPSLQQSSISVCQLIKNFKAIHQAGAHSVLVILYRATILESDPIKLTYKNNLLNPGCLEPNDQILMLVDCDAFGLNVKSCTSIPNKKCIFRDNQCQTVTDFKSVLCSDNLSKLACLSVTNKNEPCYWDNGSCLKFTISATTKCTSFEYPVSPSVCSNIFLDECFYDETNNQCNQKCRSTDNKGSQLICKQSVWDCVWTNTCLFNLTSQCGIIGQNQLGCNRTPQNCRFFNGFCIEIQSLQLLKCRDGLNKMACLNLSNSSQVCQFDSILNQCQNLIIEPDYRCASQINVNANACRKITTEGCYYLNGNCKTTSGSEACITEGLNKLACLSTSNTTKACRWDIASGTCMEKEISRTDQCNTLKLVNPVACKNVIYRLNGVAELCKYNEVTYNCENFTVDSSTTCSTKGLNVKACASISNDTLACRWISNSCVQVTSLGIAISCSSLQNVTFQTCALIQESTEKCVYSSSRYSCTTSVKKDFDCNQQGLNPRGCASLASSCYFNKTNNLCSSSTVTILNTIDCASNYPTKQACQNITTQGQYCRWNSTSSICIQQKFPTIYQCTYFVDTNKSLCLAYEVSTDQWITSDTYCTYNSTTKQCMLFTGTITGCGSTDLLNVHACVALSDSTTACYFNTLTQQCTTLTDNTLLTTLKCQYGNKKVCTTITTSGQNCQWFSDSTENKCYQMNDTFSDSCTSYLNVNPNVCAHNLGTTCKWDPTTANCIIPVGVAFTCVNNGLNEAACISTDQEPCYYDKTLFNCIKIDSTNSAKINCSDSVNQKGCLASLKMACKWDAGECSEVTDKTWTTVTCIDLVDKLYNPIVCGSVTTSNEYCSYDTASSHCQDSPVVSDCQSGYNESNCTGTGCEFKNFICADKPSPPTNVCTGKNQTDCMAVTTAACVFSNGNCLSVTILPSATCTTYQSATNKFNAVTCQSISGTACQYDVINFKCIPASGTNLVCTEPGLNSLACTLFTVGNYCKFESDFSKSSPGCSTIGDITTESCSNKLSKEACLNISNQKGICQFDVVNKSCSEIDNQLIIGTDCSDATNEAAYIYTSNYCKYLSVTSCQYDPVKHICQTASSVATCAADTSLNEIACYSNVYGEICSYSTYSFTCTVMSESNLKLLTCSNALSFKQCTQAGAGLCKWSGTACSTVTVNVSCASLTNVNSRACMANVNGTEKCQFQDSVSATSCIIPVNDIQPCTGLNKVACLANTANPCYYYEQCIDISLSPDDGACDTGYYLTQGACIRIQKAGQTCQWNGTACIKISVSSTDSCTTYSAATNSPAICASIVTSSCYWNMGCQSGNGTNCNTLGANSLACKGATSGNCIFTNYRCLDVQTNDVKTSQCTDPSNQNGCLQLNNGEPCQWSGSTCSKVSVSGGCTSYTSVNPGVCAQTSDTACQWNSNACVAVSSTTLSCAEKGLNKLGCLTKTSGSKCRYLGSLCVTIDSITISNLECSDNLNEDACKDHKKKCCQWDGSSCSSMGTVSGNCISLTNNSAFCCSQVGIQNCGYYSGCYQLTYQDVFCQEAYNKMACMWITGQCQWDQINNQCIPANKSNLGCISSLNKTACLKQSDFCMYDEVCKTGLVDKCDKLLYSNSATQCKYVTDVGCKSQTNGCIVTGNNAKCETENMNKIGCIDNINACQWNTTTLICSTADPVSNLYPTGIVSRGQCMKVAKCRMDITQDGNTCVDGTITANSLCHDQNAVTLVNNGQCSQIVTGPCMFDPINLKCSSNITGTECTSFIGNSLGCKYIQNKCYWDSSILNGGCKKYTDSTVFYSCADIYTKYTCLTNKLTACIWTSTHNCEDYIETFKTCTQLIADVTSPGVCYYYSTDFCAYNGVTCQLQASVTNCIDANSPLGCQAAGSLCYWNLSQAACLQLSSADSATTMTCPNLKYTTKQLCLKPILEGQICEWDGKLCNSANVNTVYCTNYLALNACIAVNREQEQCKFSSVCAYSDNSSTLCTDNLNIYACLAVLSDSQYCKWLGQRCSAVTDDGYLIQTHTLINQNVCRKAYTLNGQPNTELESIGVKYDIDNFICILSDPYLDDCSAPGLNYFGCLRTQVALCNWAVYKCIYFTEDITTYTVCANYQTVSPKVCSQISTTGLKCKHNDSTLNCEDYSVLSDTCDTIGLNKEACINVKLAACIWLDNYCTFNTINVGVTTCESLQNVNAYSCALVDVSTQSCKYNSKGGCSSQIDPNVERCDTAGMNKKACSLVEGQSCIFKNDHCQIYNGNETICSNLKEVNANVCSNLNSEQQPCKFSILTRSCTFVHSEDTCSSVGINEQGCKVIQANQQCTWLDGLNYCTCTGEATLKGLKSCSGLGEYQCTAGCHWNQVSKDCHIKLCSDLSLENCGGILNGYLCYKTSTNCQGASKCSQISGVSNCTLYTINGTKCGNDPYNDGHCIQNGCIHISENSCGGQCQWAGVCVAKECYTLKKENCTGVFSGKQCYWTGTQCVGVASCVELTQYINNDSTLCETYTIGGRQCKWQIDRLFSTTYECNSTACRTLGSSQSNCQGKEMNNEVCVLLPDFNCTSCEEISDACMCLNASGFCLLSNGKCVSNICTNLNQSTCLTTARCTYVDGQCKQICINLLYSQCSERALLSECNWNTYLGICENGTRATVVINTLANVVKISAYCTILMFTLAFILF